jgi:hypothetical protein
MPGFAMSRRPLLIVPLLVILAGCDQLGLESATAAAARHEAEGRAIGGACRHAGRAIEDCFALNRRTDKAAIYAGWREMDDYMRENRIQVVRPALGAASGTKRAETDEDADDGATRAARADSTDASGPASASAANKGAKLAAREPASGPVDKPSTRQ